jgi:hypothetical protein
MSIGGIKNGREIGMKVNKKLFVPPDSPHAGFYLPAPNELGSRKLKVYIQKNKAPRDSDQPGRLLSLSLSLSLVFVLSSAEEAEGHAHSEPATQDDGHCEPNVVHD